MKMLIDRVQREGAVPIGQVILQGGFFRRHRSLFLSFLSKLQEPLSYLGGDNPAYWPLEFSSSRTYPTDNLEIVFPARFPLFAF